jgi:hypothetical protein
MSLSAPLLAQGAAPSARDGHDEEQPGRRQHHDANAGADGGCASCCAAASTSWLRSALGALSDLFAPASALPTLDAVSFVADALPAAMLRRPASSSSSAAATNGDRRALALNVAKAVVHASEARRTDDARRSEAAWRRCYAQLRLLDALSDACGVLRNVQATGGAATAALAPDTRAELEWMASPHHRASARQLDALLAAARAALAEVSKITRRQGRARGRRRRRGRRGDSESGSDSTSGGSEGGSYSDEEDPSSTFAREADIPPQLRELSSSYARGHYRAGAGAAADALPPDLQPATPPLPSALSRQGSAGADENDGAEQAAAATAEQPPPPPLLRSASGRSALPRSVASLLHSRAARRKATALAAELTSIHEGALAWAVGGRGRVGGADGVLLKRLAVVWRAQTRRREERKKQQQEGDVEAPPPPEGDDESHPPATLLECVAAAALLLGPGRAADAAPMALAAAEMSALGGRGGGVGGSSESGGSPWLVDADADDAERCLSALRVASAAEMAALRRAAAAAGAAASSSSSSGAAAPFASPPLSPPSLLPAVAEEEHEQPPVAQQPPAAIEAMRRGGGAAAKGLALPAAAAAARGGDDLEVGRD